MSMWLAASLEKLNEKLAMYIIIYEFNYIEREVLGYAKTEEEAKKFIEEIKKVIPKNPFTSYDQEYAFENILENEWALIEREIENDYWENVAPEECLDSSESFNIARETLKENIKQTRYNWFKENHPNFAEYIEPYLIWKKSYYNNSDNFSYKKIYKFNLSCLNINN